MLKTLGPKILLLAGGALVVGAFAVDLLLKSSTPGLGRTQWAMIWAGVAALAIGGVAAWKSGALKKSERTPTPEAAAASPWLILQLALLAALVGGLADVAAISLQVAQGWRFVNVSRYAYQLKPYLQAFQADRVKVVPFERFVDDLPVFERAVIGGSFLAIVLSVRLLTPSRTSGIREFGCVSGSRAPGISRSSTWNTCPCWMISRSPCWTRGATTRSSWLPATRP